MKKPLFDRYGGYLVLFLLSFAIKPAFAHHMTGGQLPSNAFEGFMSGLAHPIIGIDHFVFVVAVGLLASISLKSSIILPLIFIFSTIVGTVFHVMQLNLPLAEIVIAVSVIGVGFLLATSRSLTPVGLGVIGFITGIFHGYAYGESIVGAQMGPLYAYLAGFALIQTVVILIAYQVGKMLRPSLTLRFIGCTIGGMGLAFLASTVLG